MEGAHPHHFAWCSRGAQRGGPLVGRDHPSRRDRRPLRAEGDRERRRRDHCRRRRCRRSCGPLILSGAIANGGSVLAAQAAGADLAYVGSPFIATAEANAPEGYKQAIVEGGAADIVYTDLFTGVHGNYLKSSIANAGLDPDNLTGADPTAMKFGSEGSAKSKVWRDIWGSGQGIGVIDRVRPAAELVDLLADQYATARARLGVA